MPRAYSSAGLVDLDRQLVDLPGRVPGLLVHPEHRFLRRPGRQAEHLARLRVEPGVLEVHTLRRLDLQITLVRLAQLLRGHADESVVHVHELRHVRLLTVNRPGWRRGISRGQRRGPSWPLTMAGSGWPAHGATASSSVTRGSAPGRSSAVSPG